MDLFDQIACIIFSDPYVFLIVMKGYVCFCSNNGTALVKFCIPFICYS